MNVLEKLGYGGITAVIGIFIVFLGLVIIIAMLYVMTGVFKAAEKKKARKTAAEEKSLTPEEAPSAPVQVQTKPAANEAEMLNKGELIAVIAAAIAAFDGTGTPVRIKSVRRVSIWKNAARTEQIYKF